MRWQNKERSKNVEDRRGGSGGARVGAGIGVGTIILLILAFFLGGDPGQILNQVQQQQAPTQQRTEMPGQDDELSQFVSVVLRQTELVWEKLFREELGKQYQPPKLVLFSGQVSSACGNASAATGPFYCPGDYKLYIDLSFYDQLRTRFNAPGDFAMAYIVGHEVGHHVQNLLGITKEVQGRRRTLPETEYNKLSVGLELQADFLAGVWAHHMYQMDQNILEKGDIEEAMAAAAAVGDDRIQKQARGYVVPDSFTHGTSEQRVRWFRKGLESGDLRKGDTFDAMNL